MKNSSEAGRFKSLIVVLSMAFVLSACAYLPSLPSLPRAPSFSSLPSLPSFKRASRGRVTYNAKSWCVPPKLKRVLRRVARRYGSVTVTSTYRGWFHNKRVGGARKSLHRKCKAVDFVVKGNQRKIAAYLRRQRAVGGFKKYRGGHFHIDTGKRRSW